MPAELHAVMELRGWRQDEEVEHILIVLSDVYEKRFENGNEVIFWHQKRRKKRLEWFLIFLKLFYFSRLHTPFFIPRQLSVAMAFDVKASQRVCAHSKLLLHGLKVLDNERV